MNKKGQGGLSMDTIIIAVIAIIVLLLIVTFFTGGMATIFGKIRNVFSGGTGGYDVDLAKNNCQNYCERAQLLKTPAEVQNHVYCTQEFKIQGADGKLYWQNCWSGTTQVTCQGLAGSCKKLQGMHDSGSLVDVEPLK